MPPQHVKVSFAVKRDAEGYPPVDREDLWVIAQDDGRFLIDSIPFYVSGISSGDWVYADDRGGRHEFREVAAYGGHSTVRVIVFGDGPVQAIRDELKAMGCSTELSDTPVFFSVDVPPEVSYKEVVDLLDGYVKQGVLDYEESALHH